MAFHFADFELDGERREIRLHGREIAVQPRVLDLLLYLVHNRDRVIGKDELLEALWPGTVVVDGALQRVVSLARSVLQQGGARDAIRTYARRGYRFSLEPVTVAAAAAPEADVEEGLARARLAFQSFDWDGASAGFAQADAAAPLVAADLERWAQSSYWTGDAVAAVEPLERAVAAHLSRRDRRGAARAALLLAQIAFERLELPVASGWQKRAARFLDGMEASREHGLMHYLAARMALSEGDLEGALDHAERARSIGVDQEDPDLEGLGLVYAGHALLAAGDLDRGMDYQNEAAAAVLANEITPWAGAIIYCSLIWTCRNLADWHRAGQWTEQFTRWCERRRLTGFPGTCRLHRAEVLSVRGELAEAEREIDVSVAGLAAWAPWAEGDAYRVLGDLRLGQGRIEAAASAYQRARELGWDPEPGYSLLMLARGQPEAAVSGLEATLASGGWVNLERRGTLLAHLVMATARAGRLERARTLLEELEANPDLWPTPAVEAMFMRGRGELAWAERRTADAIASLRAAIALWQDVGSPLNVAHLRVRLTEWLVELGALEAARVEQSLAQAVFREHGAVELAERCERFRLGGDA